MIGLVKNMNIAIIRNVEVVALNRRINKILLDILRAKSETLQRYAELFNVSEQTIRNDIKEINFYLEKKHATKLIIDETGFLRMAEEIDLKSVLKAYSNFQNYRLCQNERRTILALILVTSSDYITTYYLSEYVLVSRNTLVSDIEELKKWFEQNQLSLSSFTGKGYKVIGDEKGIRAAMMKLIISNGLFDQEYDYAMGFEDNIFQNLLLDIIDKKARYQEIGKLLLEVEKQHQVQLSDFAYQEVVCYLLIMIERLQLGFSIQTLEDGVDVKSSSKYNFALSLAKELELKYNQKISDKEIASLVSILRSKSYIKNNGRKIDSIEMQIMITEFIFNISKELNIKYYLNSELFDLLENHLKLLIYRVKANINVQNVLFDEIYQSYSAIFPLIKKYLQKIEEYLQVSLTLDEISFVVMYIMAIFETNDVATKNKSLKVRVVCNSGRGTAQLIKAKLTATFPNIDIISIDSTHMLRKNNPTNQDLIITTVPLQFSYSPVVLINPILTEKDIIKIQKAIYQIKPREIIDQEISHQNRDMFQTLLSLMDKYVEKEEQDEFLKDIEALYSPSITQLELDGTEVERLSDLLTMERIAFNVEVNDWREAISEAGKLLLKSELIEERYIEGMIKVIEENGSYIVISPGVAIPHADASDGAIKIGASFIKLKEAVHFGHPENDPVQYIIAFSIPEETSIGKCLYYFTEILANEDFLFRMDQQKTDSGMLLEMRKMENKVMGLTYEKNIKR
jgi:transcriptional antiterminator/mannitol/fructose-specific phosphotransferase system IIA component (Ntr-type)